MPAPVSVNLGKLFTAAFLRWALRIFLCLLLLLTVVLAGVYVFLQRDPEKLIARYLAPIEQKTGLDFKIGAIDVTLLPLPAVTLRNIAITGPELIFTAGRLTARPGLLKILTGDFMPALVSIERSRLDMRTDLPLSDPRLWLERLPGSGGAGGHDLPDFDFALSIARFSAQISGPYDNVVSLVGANSELDIDGARLDGSLEFAALRLTQGQKQQASIENFRIAGNAGLNDFLRQPASLKLGCVFRAAGICGESTLAATFDSSAQGWNAAYELASSLDLDGYHAPLQISGRAQQIAGSPEILLRDIAWRLEHDSGSLDLACYLPPDNSAFELKGAFGANRLSLTQWMGWARNLPPGLQLALDNITQASLNFTVTRKGLAATAIKAECAGSTFTGTGGVADWSKPEVVLTLATPEAVLVNGVPEAVGRSPAAPAFGHPPLTPLPNEPLKPGESGIGYQISLSAQLLHYGLVKFQNASLLIHPGKLDKTGFRDCLLDARGDFYGGKATGACILGADPSLPYHISAKATDINMAAMARDLAVTPFRAGKVDASAVVTSRGKQLTPFLAALRGELNASGTGLRSPLASSNLSLPRLEASLKLRSGAFNGEKLTMDGVWRASTVLDDLEAACELNGKLAFGSDGLTLRNVPGELKASRKGGLSAQLKGTFSASSDAGRVEVSRATLTALGESAQGEVKLAADKKPISYQGNFRTEIKSLARFLAKAGMAAAVPGEWDALRLAADFSGTQDEIKLAKIDARAGQTAISGNLAWNMDKKHLSLDLAANQIKLSGGAAKKRAKTSWNYAFLTGFGADGVLASRDLVAWDMRLVNARLPFHLEKGKLTVNKATANFCGGPVVVHASADFNRGLVFDASLSVRDFNLTQAARDRKLETRLTGSGSGQAKLGANLQGSAKFIDALTAQWAFTIKNGSWQTSDKGQLKGKPNTFRQVKASGNLREGFLRSDNFTLDSESLEVVGGGWLNLDTRQIDCDFNVDFNGLPAFPLRLYGPLAQPKTSIGAGRMALNAIGSLATGFSSAIGGLVKGVWSLILP